MREQQELLGCWCDWSQNLFADKSQNQEVDESVGLLLSPGMLSIVLRGQDPLSQGLGGLKTLGLLTRKGNSSLAPSQHIRTGSALHLDLGTIRAGLLSTSRVWNYALGFDYLGIYSVSNADNPCAQRSFGGAVRNPMGKITFFFLFLSQQLILFVHIN